MRLKFLGMRWSYTSGFNRDCKNVLSRCDYPSPELNPLTLYSPLPIPIQLLGMSIDHVLAPKVGSSIETKTYFGFPLGGLSIFDYDVDVGHR
jgi:hypothetical protein